MQEISAPLARGPVANDIGLAAHAAYINSSADNHARPETGAAMVNGRTEQRWRTRGERISNIAPPLPLMSRLGSRGRSHQQGRSGTTIALSRDTHGATITTA